MLKQESIDYLEELIDWDISEINQTLSFLKGRNGTNDIQIDSYQRDLERALRVKQEINNNNNGNI